MALFALLLACSTPDGAAPDAWTDRLDAIAPPPAPVLELSPLVAGERAQARASGVPLGTEVWFLATTSGVGDGPCLGPVCLELLPPLHRLGAATAGADGTATVRFRLPDGLAGATLCAQALARGPEPVSSGAVCAPVEGPAHAWWTTCGDPVCSGYGGPWPGVPPCADDESPGDPCADPGATCDPMDACNALRVCADEDPTLDGCPISRASAKQHIHPLTPAERDAAAAAALATPLATWQYTGTDVTRMGFIIDDVPGSPAVRPAGDRVDLYGYTSLVLAAVQSQQERIDALEARLDACER